MSQARTALGRFCLLCALCMTAPALAQEAEPTEGAAESRSESFVAVQGAVKEDIAGGPLMLGAYGVTWVLLFLYVARLVSMQRRTLQEVERLAAVLEQAGTGKQE